MRRGLLALDLDGVLLEEGSSWEIFHRLLGTAGTERERNMELFFSGRIDYEEWAMLDAGLWTGMEIGPVDDYLANMDVSEGAHELVASMHELGVVTAIVSTGISRIARWVGTELGIDEVVSNDVEVTDGRITGRVKVRCPFYGKGSVVRALARRVGLPLSRSACVGDGENDLTMFDVVGFSVAHNPESNEVAARADRVVRGGLRQTRDVLVEHFKHGL